MVIGKYTDVFRRIFGWGEGGGLRTGGYVEGTFHGGICHGGREISMKGVQDFLALLQNRTMLK